MDKIRQSLEVVFDVDSYGGVPDSDSDDDVEGTGNDIVDSPDNTVLNESTIDDNDANEDDEIIEGEDSM